METSYISRTSGIGTRDKIGYAMGDLASLLVFGLVQSCCRNTTRTYSASAW